ncbi:conserved hypothetical protein [Cupriavidus phytorum]|uniref:Calcineurin-like phosphoesterase domain-containing protein n=1 Tax=Cupriavidus taiwanensis TaxID=164546 RepID=A0A976A733_9BURK|nr:hypothetical protein [Cupriavidus taiwanensis]SOY65603.1 conserved hypothetical protein [Cupriavidus taiwanensis]
MTRDDLIQQYGSVRAAARAMGVSESTLRSRLERGAQFEAAEQIDEDLPIEELLEIRKRKFAQKARAETANKVVDIKVKVAGPVGILHFGDPHVDDDGTDIVALEKHAKLIRDTEGLFGANIGDVSNNWVGRLARLYAEQSTTAKEAWRLTEWFIGSVDWLYLVGGNHDAWSGAGDPLQWLARGISGVHKDHGVRMSLNFPNRSSVMVNARHDFAGNSIYNPAHGVMKATHFGTRDHLSICGHKHVSGYGVLKDPDSGRVCHALQIASYKVYDRYAKERGFRDSSLSPCAVTVIDPALPDSHADKIKVFWDADEGAAFLKYKRRKV